jgi:hypothetical protein
MSIERSRERILLNEKEEGRQLAVDEVLALKYRYEGSFYTFEYGGGCVTARFVAGCLQTAIQPANGYRIELLASHETLVDGPCVITDIHNHKVNAIASTLRGNTENLITIETAAFQPFSQGI